jgi:ABC-type transporter Mla MlaB component
LTLGVVFSFFKKDPKDPKKGVGARTKPPAVGPRTGGATDVTTRPMPKPIGRPLSAPVNRSLDRPSAPPTAFPLTETALPERERARNRARETAAKIDAIESEMARDIMRGLGRNTEPAPAAKVAAARPAVDQAVAPPPAARPPALVEQSEANSDILGGDIDAIEINTSGVGSVIDETAILFSNGQIEEAEAVLRAGLRAADLGASTQLAWHMLFELVNQRGDKGAFEKLTMDYVLRFENSPPAWVDYVEIPVGRPVMKSPVQPAAGGAPGVRLPGSIDGNIVGQLEQLRSLTAAHAAVQLDVSDATQVDIAGADLLLRVFKAFKRSQRELTLVGAASFVEVLSRSIESGRRDPSDSVWMLLLEVQRMLGQQEEFEETAIQYCITFEVSPPSWEPAPANLKVVAASSSPQLGSPPASAASTSPFELRGVIEGEGEPHFGRLVAASRNQPQVAIDCRQLRRLAFSAGSALLGTLRKVQQGGSEVELHNVNALVAALLNLLGITSIVPVQPRRG